MMEAATRAKKIFTLLRELDRFVGKRFGEDGQNLFEEAFGKDMEVDEEQKRVRFQDNEDGRPKKAKTGDADKDGWHEIGKNVQAETTSQASASGRQGRPHRISKVRARPTERWRQGPRRRGAASDSE